MELRIPGWNLIFQAVHFPLNQQVGKPVDETFQLFKTPVC
jgi:hypothetical protein